jgi:hypothetical protein
MDHAETVAKLILETVLPGASLKYRISQSSSEYDFDMHLNGIISAVEVTASVDRVHVQTIAAIRNKKKGGPIIPAKKCKKRWIVFPSNDAQINAIRTKIDDYLSNLESEGIGYFSDTDSGPKSVQDICSELRLTRGLVYSETLPPDICLGSPVGGER